MGNDDFQVGRGGCLAMLALIYLTALAIIYHGARVHGW